jgi:hypothetical protein
VDYLRLPAAPQGEKYRHLVRRELSEAASARTVLAVTREGLSGTARVLRAIAPSSPARNSLWTVV